MNTKIGHIYKIIAVEGTECYVGSTFNTIRDRFKNHKSAYVAKNFRRQTSAKNLFDKYGIEGCKMILIKDYPVIDRQHLEVYELLWIKKLKAINKCEPFARLLRAQQKKQYYQKNKEAICNRVKEYQEANKEVIAEKKMQYREKNKEAIAERDKKYREANKEILSEKKKQYLQENKEAVAERLKRYREANKEVIAEKQKQYREENKENLNERHKQYYQENKQTIFEKQKIYYQTNREAIDERHKQYYEAHKEAIVEYHKQYYQANKEAMLQKYREKVTCECGKEVTRGTLTRHKKSIKHQNWEEQNL